MNILESAYGRFNIYVNQVATLNEDLVHLSFVDKNNQTQIVLMRQTAGKWFFADPQSVPHWINSLREQFDALIQKEILQN